MLEFELNRYELYDLQIDQDCQLIVECEYDAEYSPEDGIDNKFCWSLIIRRGQHRLREDITDELSEDDYATIQQEVERFFA
jgi:hypothetical protein